MKNTFPFTHDDDPMKSWHYHYFPGDVTWFHNGSPSKILTRGGEQRRKELRNECMLMRMLMFAC